MCAAVALACAGSAASSPFIWDEDGDRVDDRIESVHLLGYQFSFENADSLQRQKISVVRLDGVLSYSVYVVYDNPPTPTDFATLGALAMPVLHRYESVPAVRTIATYPQAQAAAALPGVERVEAIEVLHPMLRDATAAMAMRDPSEHAFPTIAGTGGADGAGVVVAFLDSGINDEPDGAYPGHESLIGRCLGGASFVGGDSLGDTQRDGSMNPSDHGGLATQAHGTHVASLALGTGGATGYAVGVAPAARFVDVKVLNDAGIGTGVTEALDWCIHNRSRDWGGPAGFEGIDVISLSLSSLDPSDGNDLASRIADRAVALGVVVVASMGNDGEAANVPSPAGGDRVLAIGASDHQRTAVESDDLVPSFNNYGPRAGDGDFDPSDEQKPDLLAPGVSVLGADGDLSSDGAQYRRMSGTSMAAALAAGSVAVLKSADPSLTPGQIKDLLRATARRTLGGGPPGPAGPDPRWSASLGFGAIDLYAADLERVQPTRSQVASLELVTTSTTIEATLRTQRESGAGHFVFERASDVAGLPGSFAVYDSVSSAGDASLADPVNRTAYTRSWSVPGNERGVPFWYRAAYTEGGVRFNGPARRFASPLGPSAATLELTIVHNAFDNDLNAAVTVGGGEIIESGPPALIYSVPGTNGSVASEWVTGASAIGNVAWTYRIEVPQGAANTYLPPNPADPWRLEVEEGGYLNRSGRITDFRIIWHGPDGDQEYVGWPVPVLTSEGQTSTVVAPNAVASVSQDQTVMSRFGPNPVLAGGAVAFTMPAAAGDLRIYDVNGRLVGRTVSRPEGSGLRAQWRALDQEGRPLAAGIYLAQPSRGRAMRLVVVRP